MNDVKKGFLSENDIKALGRARHALVEVVESAGNARAEIGIRHAMVVLYDILEKHGGIASEGVDKP